jgi:hypothetical protein
MKREFTLDPEACAALDAIAANYPGGADAVLNAILHDLTIVPVSEERMREIEEDPRFQAMMERSEADFRAGLSIPHEEVMARLQARRNSSSL